MCRLVFGTPDLTWASEGAPCDTRLPPGTAEPAQRWHWLALWADVHAWQSASVDAGPPHAVSLVLHRPH